jgi:hypothetical protein
MLPTAIVNCAKWLHPEIVILVREVISNVCKIAANMATSNLGGVCHD